MINAQGIRVDTFIKTENSTVASQVGAAVTNPGSWDSAIISSLAEDIPEMDASSGLNITNEPFRLSTTVRDDDWTYIPGHAREKLSYCPCTTKVLARRHFWHLRDFFVGERRERRVCGYVCCYSSSNCVFLLRLTAITPLPSRAFTTAAVAATMEWPSSSPSLYSLKDGTTHSGRRYSITQHSRQ